MTGNRRWPAASAGSMFANCNPGHRLLPAPHNGSTQKEELMGSFIHTAGRTADQARSSLIDLGGQALKLRKSLRAIEARGVDSLLDGFGLQRRGGALGPAVWFAAGAVTASAIVLLLAPESSKKVRDRIAELWPSRGEKKAELPNGVSTVTPNAHEELAH